MVRIHPTDHRIAQRVHLNGGDYPDDTGYWWVCVTAPHGVLQMEVLKDHEVEDWLPVELPGGERE